MALVNPCEKFDPQRVANERLRIAVLWNEVFS